MRPLRAGLMMVALASVLLAGCASTELPEQSSDAALQDSGEPDAGADALDVAREDASPDDVGPSDDVSDDATSCEPATCESLSACGTVDDGCGSTLDCGACPDVQSVQLSPPGNQVLPVGDSLQLSATASAAGGQETFCQFSWSSQDPTVARVDTSGKVSGVKAGIADVRAECRGTSAKVRVYVNDSGLPANLIDPNALAIWLRADVGLDFSGGAQVEAWEDLSGNAFQIASNTFSHNPMRVSSGVNGHAVLRFTGNQELRSDAHVALSEATILAVVKNSEATHRGQILSNCGDGGNNQMRFDGSATGLYLHGEQNGLDEAVTLNNPTTAFQLISVVLSGSQLRVFQNSQEQTSVALTTSGTWNFGQVGARCSSEYLEGDIAEIMVYDAAMSDADRQKVEGYLTSRYAL